MAMPVAMTKPILNRETAPAPVANIKGKTPNTIAAVVIKMGLKRMLAADSIASRLDRPYFCLLLANSTMRMPCLLIKPIKVTKPTSV